MLQNIFGNLLGGVIRIAVIAATLALIYYFAIRPVLDTTEKLTNGTTNSINNIFDQVNSSFGDEQAKQIQKQIRQSQNSGNKTKINKLMNCVQSAGTNQNQIQRCVSRFTP